MYTLQIRLNGGKRTGKECVSNIDIDLWYEVDNIEQITSELANVVKNMELLFGEDATVE